MDGSVKGLLKILPFLCIPSDDLLMMRVFSKMHKNRGSVPSRSPPGVERHTEPLTSNCIISSHQKSQVR